MTGSSFRLVEAAANHSSRRLPRWSLDADASDHEAKTRIRYPAELAEIHECRVALGDEYGSQLRSSLKEEPGPQPSKCALDS